MDQHRNPKFWKETKPREWDFNGWSVLREQEEAAVPGDIKSPKIFEANDRLEYDRDTKYITIGKGWP